MIKYQSYSKGRSNTLLLKENIEKLRLNPIYRATRCDKIRISIMETILRTYYTSKNIEHVK